MHVSVVYVNMCVTMAGWGRLERGTVGGQTRGQKAQAGGRQQQLCFFLLLCGLR